MKLCRKEGGAENSKRNCMVVLFQVLTSSKIKTVLELSEYYDLYDDNKKQHFRMAIRM